MNVFRIRMNMSISRIHILVDLVDPFNFTIQPLEIELAYNDAAVQHVNNYITRNLTSEFDNIKNQ